MRKFIYPYILLLIFALLLTGCGPSDAEIATMTAEDWTPTPSQTPTPIPTPTPTPLNNPWSGQWWKVKEHDDSVQSIEFVGPDEIYLIDRGASICGLDEAGNPMYAADGQGVGSVSNDTFTVTLEIRCLTDEPYLFGDMTFEFVYDPATDMIKEGESPYTRSKP